MNMSKCLKVMAALLLFCVVPPDMVTAAEPEANPDKPRLVVQAGHAEDVTSVVFASNGRTVFSGSIDKSIIKWDTLTGKIIKVINAHDSSVWALALSKDGKKLISGGYDNSIKIWDAETTKELSKIAQGHSKPVWSVAISNDGKIVSGSNDNTLKIWSLSETLNSKSKNKKPIIIYNHDGPVRSVAITSNGNIAVSGSEDKTVKLWNLKDTTKKNPLITLPHVDEVYCVAISKDGTKVISGGKDNIVRLWDVNSKKVIGVFNGHTGPVRSVSFSDDESKALSSSEDKTIRIWDLNNKNQRHNRIIGKHSEMVYSAVFSTMNDTVLSCSKDHSLKLWDISTHKELLRYEGRLKRVYQVTISPNEKLLATANYDNTAKIWDLSTGQRSCNDLKHEKWVRSAAFSFDSQRILTGSGDNSFKFWDTNTCVCLSNDNSSHNDRIRAVSLSKRGKYIASADRNKILLKNSISGEEIPFKSEDEIWTLAFSPDEKTFISGDGSGKIKRWPITGIQEEKYFIGHKGSVRSVAFSNDSKTFFTSGDDNKVKKWNTTIWDNNDNEFLKEFEGHKGIVWSVSVSPHSDTILSGSDDKTIILWDMNGNRLKTLKEHSDWVSSVTYFPSGDYAASSSNDGSVIVWNLNTGKWIVKLYSFTDGTWAVIDPAGRFDASSGGDVDGLHWVINNVPIALKQLKQRYYEPGLLAKIMGFNKQPMLTVPDLMANPIKLFPEVTVDIPKDSSNATITLKNRGGGIGKVLVLVNGIEIAADARGPKPDPEAKSARLQVEIPEALLDPGQENNIQVLAWNKEDWLSSSGEPVRFRVSPAPKKPDPILYAIVVGVSRYAEPSINLKFSGKDAADMATALAVSAKRLLGVDKTDITLLSDYEATPQLLQGEGVKIFAPTRDNIQKAFAFLKKIKSTDILVVYLSGHGTMAGSGDASDYYYLTPAARSTDLSDLAVRGQYGISSAELTEWINKIPANKRVMVLDTCAAGGAAAKLIEKKDLPTSQILALDRLKDRTGFHVLMGSTADKSSLEASQYGQGLLTWAILQGMKGAALREGEYVDVQKLFQHAADKVPELAKSVGGIQRPIVAAPRGTSFDIGRVDEKIKPLIPLATLKPMILKATFQDDNETMDVLGLGKAVNARLREQSAWLRGAIEFVYVGEDEFPGAWQMAGRYKRVGDKISVTVKLRDGVRKKEFTTTGMTSDIAGLSGSILEKATNAIK